MTITSMRIVNFKSWRDTGEMELAPITGVFGANSSGKSALLHFLLMLKQTAESADRSEALNLGDGRGPVELGTFIDILHGRKPVGEISFEVEWQPPKVVRLTVPTAAGGEVKYGTHRIRFEASIRLAQSQN